MQEKSLENGDVLGILTSTARFQRCEYMRFRNHTLALVTRLNCYLLAEGNPMQVIGRIRFKSCQRDVQLGQDASVYCIDGADGQIRQYNKFGQLIRVVAVPATVIARQLGVLSTGDIVVIVEPEVGGLWSRQNLAQLYTASPFDTACRPTDVGTFDYYLTVMGTCGAQVVLLHASSRMCGKLCIYE
jgi:hypothetical protein